MSGALRALIVAAGVLAPALALAQQAMPPQGAASAASGAGSQSSDGKPTMGTNKAGKPPSAEMASQPTAKKPAKAGAQSGPSASDPPK